MTEISEVAPPAQPRPAHVAELGVSQNSPTAAGGGRFTLGTLLLWMTLISIIFAAMAFSKVLGILLLLVSAPALARCALIVKRRSRRGRRLSSREKAMLFGESMGIMFPGVFFSLIFSVVLPIFFGAAAIQGEVFIQFLCIVLLVGIGVIFYCFFRATLPEDCKLHRSSRGPWGLDRTANGENDDR